MWGAIIGDIIGSTFEAENNRSPYFELFRKNARFTEFKFPIYFYS